MEWVEFIGHRYNGSTMTVVFATSMFGVSLGAFAVMVRFFELRLRLESEVLSDSAKAQRSSQRTLVKATNSKTDVYANGVQVVDSAPRLSLLNARMLNRNSKRRAQFVVAVMLFVPLVLMSTANLIPLFLYLQPVDALASFSCSQMEQRPARSQTCSISRMCASCSTLRRRRLRTLPPPQRPVPIMHDA